MKISELMNLVAVFESPDIAFLSSLLAIATGVVLVATYGGVTIPNIILVILGASWILQGLAVFQIAIKTKNLAHRG